jgi:hypothetical protein
MTGQELEPLTRDVIHPVTGEILDLAQESVEGLAGRVVDLQETREALAVFDRALSDALLDHLDRGANWTLRVGEPTDDRQIEIKAASPSAGTEAYPPDALERELRTLVDRGTISEQAAGKALKRQVVLTLDVPLSLVLSETAKGLAEISIEHCGEEMSVVNVDQRQVSVVSGINALRKFPVVAEALDAAMVVQSPPARRVRVTVKTRGGA